MFNYMHNNNYQCKMCWNKALTVALVQFNSGFIPLCSLNTSKGVFNPNVSQVVRSVCTLVLFINPRHAVVVPCVCMYVCVFALICHLTHLNLKREIPTENRNIGTILNFADFPKYA